MSETTYQQKFFEAAYLEAASGLAFPDPKIAGDQLLVNEHILTLGSGTGATSGTSRGRTLS